jgi:hypothetical protein
MEIQEIDVFLQTDGTVRIEVRGVKGQKCLALTEDLEKLLGGQVIAREKTPEFDESAQATVSETERVNPDPKKR